MVVATATYSFPLGQVHPQAPDGSGGASPGLAVASAKALEDSGELFPPAK